MGKIKDRRDRADYLSQALDQFDPDDPHNQRLAEHFLTTADELREQGIPEDDPAWKVALYPSEFMASKDSPQCNAPRRPWLAGVSLSTGNAILFQPRCKSWQCPACAEINRRLWAVRTFHGAAALRERGAHIYFLTITSHEALSPQGTITIFPDAWKKLRQRAYRMAGKYQYLMVPEKHVSGRMHVHMVETAGLSTRWWKDNARECGFGYMVEEEECSQDGRAAWYVVKYLGKQMSDNVAWPKRFRRVRVSREWPELPQKEGTKSWHWRLVEDGLVAEQNRLIESGFNVQILDHYQAWVYARAHEGEAPQE